MATLKTVQGILDDIAAGVGSRGTTGEALQDLVESLASVYGLFNYNLPDPGTQVMSGAWENLTIYDSARDTRGVQDDLPNGQFIVKAGGGGRWEVMGYAEVSVDTAGLYRFRPRMIRADDSHIPLISQKEKTLAVGEEVAVLLAGINPADSLLDTGDRMSLQIRGPAGAIVSGNGGSGFVRVKRI